MHIYICVCARARACMHTRYIFHGTIKLIKGISSDMSTWQLLKVLKYAIAKYHTHNSQNLPSTKK